MRMTVGSGTPGAEPRGGGVDRATAESVLERILGSRAFEQSPLSREFLAYVAHETLEGRGDQLSERSVGRNALDRPELFDGRSDSAVRVRATRVRKALTAYYAGEGASEPIRLVLPAGRYSVAFEATERLASPGDDPVLLVIRPLASDAAAERVSSLTVAAVAHTLARFPGLRVAGPVPSDEDIAAAARSRGAGYVLTGSAHSSGDVVRLRLQVVEACGGTTIWTGDHDHRGDAAAADDWALTVAAEVGDYTGVVLRDVVATSTESEGVRAAKNAYFAFVQNEEVSDFLPVIARLEQAVRLAPRDPVLLSQLANALAARPAYINDGVDLQDVARAEALARQVLALDPQSGQAHIALGIAALMRTEPVGVRHHAESAARCWPHHPSTLLGSASLLSAVGDWGAAATYARRALERSTLLPGYSWTVVAVDRLLAHDDAAALAAASHIHAPGLVWGPLYRALAQDGLGRHDLAREEMAAALEVEPLIVADPSDFLERFWHWEPEQLASLLARFERYRALEASGERGA
jgi:TolB-like protein